MDINEILIKLTVPTVIGAIIGYITNWLAIKMLFRPYTKKYIAGIPVPFTPGVIPKEREKIIDSIAETLEKHLLTEEKIREFLEKNQYREQLKGRIEVILEDMVDNTVESMKETLKTGISAGKVNIKLTLLLPLFEKTIDKITPTLKKKLKDKLIKKASDTLEKNIEEEISNLLKNLQVKEIVKESLQEIEVQELERLLIGISKKQLNHITIFGAILGALIGFIQGLLLVFGII
jgi:uncharacterized membrane protein YheB (UPF0754 family)